MKTSFTKMQLYPTKKKKNTKKTNNPAKKTGSQMWQLQLSAPLKTVP